MRMFIVAFWVFVAVMLAWQAYNFNKGVDTYVAAHPEKHYFYDPSVTSPPKPHVPAPDVHQVAYHVAANSPALGNFTVNFTVKNLGDVAATGIQVKVRPYRGNFNGDEDNGHSHGAGVTPPDDSGRNKGDLPGSVAPLSDQDPTSQYGQWVALPDLAPGQTASASVTFPDQDGKIPNENPNLEIDFEPVKAK